MPELPEVETARRMLEPLLVGERITGVDLRRRDMVTTPDDPPGGWNRSRGDASAARAVRPSELLVGTHVARLERRGKALALVGASDRVVVLHLGMTGWIGPAPEPLAAHTHVVWKLKGGQRVVFSDPRRFGGLWCLPSTEALCERWSLLGPDALTVRARELRSRAAHRTTAIKAALLNQSLLAGVGNIYADEALFRARVHPCARCCDLPTSVWPMLARAIRHELGLGIRWGGASVQSYRRPDGTTGSRQQSLNVYSRTGQPCTRCGSRLSGSQVAQRTTVWCPSCQKLSWSR